MALSQQFRSVRVLPIFILPFSYNFIIIIMIIIIKIIIIIIIIIIIFSHKIPRMFKYMRK